MVRKLKVTKKVKSEIKTNQSEGNFISTKDVDKDQNLLQFSRFV